MNTKTDFNLAPIWLAEQHKNTKNNCGTLSESLPDNQDNLIADLENGAFARTKNLIR